MEPPAACREILAAGLAIIAPKFCTIIGSVLGSIYSLIVEFDVYA
jgi:hypothetical protein